MRLIRFALGNLLRDLRSGSLGVLLLAVIVAVASLTAIAFFTDRVGQAIERQANDALAADLRLRSGEKPPDRYLELAHSMGLDTARVLRMPTVATVGDASQLVDIMAVTAGYPLRGQLRVADALGGEPRVTTDIPAPGEVWAQPEALTRLGAHVGQQIHLGSATLTISRVLAFRPDQGMGLVDFSPEVIINFADVASTRLLRPGSRVRWSLLFAGDEARVAAFRKALEPQLQTGEALRDSEDTSRQLRSSIDRAKRFLTLVAMVSVLLSAVAVAMAARRFAETHMDAAAIMKCVGAPQAFILRTSLVQLLALALGAAVVGGLAGWVLQLGIVALTRDLTQVNLPGGGMAPLWLGLGTAVMVLAGFALPPIARLRSVPPVRVLRRDAAAPGLSAWVAYGSATLAVALMIWWLVRETQLLLIALGGIAATIVALVAAGRLLVWAVGRARMGVGVAWRYGMANVARRGGESVIQIAAFGIGLMVLLLLTVVRGDLLDAWQTSLPTDAPNRFLINIQPQERQGIAAMLQRSGIGVPQFSPLVRARLTEINGEAATEARLHDPDARRWLRGESNLSWREDLPASNKVVAGHWWSDQPGSPQISIAERAARQLGVGLGDRLTFSAAGQPVEGTITSIRRVDWSSFEPNFFILFSPGSLEQAPATYIASFFAPPDTRRAVAQLMRAYPSVSVIDLEAIIDQVREVMTRAAIAIQYVFLFALLAGVVVLLAAVQATRDERRYEAALLSTLGGRRGTILKGIAAEFLTMGALAGALAAAGAAAVGAVLAARVFEFQYTADPWLALWGPLSGMMLVGLAGFLATRRAVSVSPVTILRAV